MMRSEYVEADLQHVGADLPAYAKAPAGRQVRPATAGVSRSATITAPPSVECIDTLDGFQSLRSEWTELLAASAAPHPFLTWEWLHAWWMHLRGTSELRLLVVRAGGELIAIAPLRVSPGTVPWFSRMEFLGTGHAGSDYLDVIARRGHEDNSLRALTRFLQSRKMALRLSHLPTGSLAARLADQLGDVGWVSSVTDGGTCPIIALAGHSWDSYLATLGGSHRANVRRRIKGLGQHFQMRFDRVTTDAERQDMLARLVAFHDRRFDAQGGSTAFLTPAVRDFQDDATRMALEGGWLRMYVLRLNDVPAAVMYGFACDGRFYFYQHGFDDQFKEHSVGLVLMGLTIRAAIDEGLREFDMLWGLEPYKFLWARERRLLHQIELFPTDIGGRIHHGAVAARRSAATLARRGLVKLHDLGVPVSRGAADLKNPSMETPRAT